LHWIGRQEGTEEPTTHRTDDRAVPQRVGCDAREQFVQLFGPDGLRFPGIRLPLIHASEDMEGY